MPATNQERAQCGTESGSDRMLPSMMKYSIRAAINIDASIRSLPLSVLQWLHFGIEFANDKRKICFFFIRTLVIQWDPAALPSTRARVQRSNQYRRLPQSRQWEPIAVRKREAIDAIGKSAASRLIDQPARRTP